MASKMEGEKFRDLIICPLCLDTFSKATFLSCGHTFCRECLESYVVQQNNPDSIKCPVCREATKMRGRRVAELTPNFSVRGLTDALDNDVKNRSSRLCPSHGQVYMDIFCDDCEEFICLTCYVADHQGHRIHKYEELEEEWRVKRTALIKKSERRKAQLEEFENDTEQDRIDIHCHLSNVDKGIRDTFAKKVTLLQEMEEGLLEEVDVIRKDSDKKIDDGINQQRLLVEEIDSSITAGNAIDCFDSDTLKAFHLQCNDLYNSFGEHIEEQSIIDAKQTAKSARFCPDDENALALGRVEDVEKQKAEARQASGQLTHYKSVSNNNSVTIVRKVDLPDNMWGMAVDSGDAVVVGYGDQREGADRFFLSGRKEQYMDSGVGNVWDSGVGNVWDIAIQTNHANGRSVISNSRSTCYVYEANGSMCEGQMAKYCSEDGGWYLMLCSDQHDNIYAVNYNREIYIFKGSQPQPRSIVPTGDAKSSQICATKTGVMITSTCDTTPSTITVFDREGHVGSSIPARDDNEYLYAAVDTQDRVLVGRVRGESDVLGLSRYMLNGTELTMETKFKDIKLPHNIDSVRPTLSYWCYMVSLTPDRLAFANHNHLYFIDISNGGFWNRFFPSWSS